MNILITGSSGMVGSNIKENAGFKEHTLLCPSSSELNLLDFKSTVTYLRKNSSELIIHCAGRVGGIQANIANPVAFLTDNLDMGRNIVLAAKEVGIKNIINLGSSCMYPRNAKNPLKEDQILTGELEPTNEGYALAKITTARLCDYISKTDPSYTYKTVIPCNLFGRHDKFEDKNSHMIPAVIKKILLAKDNNENNVEIWGDGQARREFMYAAELADFLALAVKNLASMPNYINVGIGKDYSINDYYKVIAKITGYQGSFIHDLTKPVGMKQKLVCTDRLSSFGWKSNLTLEQGIEKTVNYYLEEVRSL